MDCMNYSNSLHCIKYYSDNHSIKESTKHNSTCLEKMSAFNYVYLSTMLESYKGTLYITLYFTLYITPTQARLTKVPNVDLLCGTFIQDHNLRFPLPYINTFLPIAPFYSSFFHLY